MKRPGPCDADVPVVVLRSLHRHMSRTVYRLVPYNRCRQWLHHWNRANERGNPLWLGPTLTRAGWTPETAVATMVLDERARNWGYDKLAKFQFDNLVTVCVLADFLVRRGVWPLARDWLGREASYRFQGGRTRAEGAIFRSNEGRFIGLGNDGSDFTRLASMLHDIRCRMQRDARDGKAPDVVNIKDVLQWGDLTMLRRQP